MSADPLPFEPRRFRTAATHYLAGRPAYPPGLIRRVAQLVGLDGTGRVLDLGCGPGQLGIGFAYFASEVLAIDPEPEMLRIAASTARGLVPNLTVMQGSSQDIGPALGRFRATVMGRSFHWMDRAETLRRLDTMLEPGGAVVLLGDRHLDVPENAWRAEYRELLDGHAPQDNYRTARRGGSWVRHEAFLLDSAFCQLETVSVIERRRTKAADLVDRALSMSGTSRARIGDAADVLAQQVGELAARIAPDGVVTEVVEAHAVIARRPK
jgi:SAM-dependent methyltransferase